ncbi:MAG: hypothetical protein FJY75_04370 [Candidatus Eisenbacteria bacterium]|uniref:Uncharacterized protein n=1 Tax=Eiseniibacteriota bacterium TaxID=2212470 RepID=A0A938BLI7_UNCEI|nr:hypothetical protein [Candidatus Eisenbacteria bacterium]
MHDEQPPVTPPAAGTPAGERPDLLLLHPVLGPEAMRAFVRGLWGDLDRSLPPPGYRDISFAFHGLRAFCRDLCPVESIAPDPRLLPRVTAWVDDLAREWRFSEVFAVQDLDFWDFLRDDLVRWLHARLVERAFIDELVARGYGTVTAVGIDAGQRRLLRRLAEDHPGRLRVEVAFLDPPVPAAAETVAGRRARKLFFLLQDGWHGVRLLVENLLDRRPRVLFVSSSRCWQRSWFEPGRVERTDIHLGRVWSEGRRRGGRFYYRSDSYHPDVGAMTAGRLAPLYIQLVLFLLVQTSRGFWEVRRVQRQWRELAERADFRAALVCEGLNVDELITLWFESAVALRLPRYTRETRRERHFLKGMRPAALLLSLERGAHRPILAAARRLGIPTLGVQTQPLPPGAYGPLGGPPQRPGGAGSLDRVCVFSAETRRRLVEEGGFDPATVIVTGDPRLGAADHTAGIPREALRGLRAAWGAEADQRVIAVVCRPEEAPEVLFGLSGALRDRDDVFLVLRLEAGSAVDEARSRRLAARRGLRWFHCDGRRSDADWLAAADLLVTTSWEELAEGLRLGTPAVWIAWAKSPAAGGPAVESLATIAADGVGLQRALLEKLSGPPERLPLDGRRRAFLAAVYGEAPQDAPARILEAVEGLLSSRAD